MARSKAGRKRKGGKRHPGGQLVRTPKIDKGTPEVQARRGRYAGVKADPTQTIDAVGRAWCAGLLTDDERDIARRFAVLYWRKLPAPNPISGLYREMISGVVDELPAGWSREAMLLDIDDKDKKQEFVLNRLLQRLSHCGRPVRRAFDQLVLDPWFDCGPPWLDAIIDGRDDAISAMEAARKAGERPYGRAIEVVDWPMFIKDVAAITAFRHAMEGIEAISR